MTNKYMQRLMTLLEAEGGVNFDPEIDIDGQPGTGKGKPSPSGKPNPEDLRKKAGQIDWTKINLRGISPRQHDPHNPGNPIPVLIQALRQFNYFLANDREPSGPMMKSMKQAIQDSPRLDELDIKVLKTCFNYLKGPGEDGIRQLIRVNEEGNLVPNRWDFAERGLPLYTISSAKSSYYFLKNIYNLSQSTNLPYSPSLQAALAEALGKLHGFSMLDDHDED